MRSTTSGVQVASFSLAVERDTKDNNGERGVDFLDCVAWRHTAEFVDKYFKKGHLATVKGRLQVREWRDKNDNKRQSVEIVADSVYFGESKAKAEATYSAPAPSDFAELDMDDGDLPF